VEREEAAAGGEKKPLPRGCDRVAESPPRGSNSIAPAVGGFFTSPISAAITTAARRRDAASHRAGRHDQACFLGRGDEGRGGAAEAGGPTWGLQASISAFAALKDVPIGYWPVLIMDDIHHPGAAGIHLDRSGRPFALVEYGPTWSLAASHECLEILVDPSGNRQFSGPSPTPEQGEVSFLVEVCDPSEGAQFGYTIDGIFLSDFCTPNFFEHAGAGARYSFTGAIKQPLEVLKNGYLSWYEPVSKSWY
jgi:hypothetical protein